MNKHIVRKRRTREHIIADLSVNHFERQALLCGHTLERVRGDYGYDLLLFTYDTHGERETGEIYLQVKATDHLPLLKDGSAIRWRLLRSDLASWLYSTVPVILVIYNARTDSAHWLYVQRHFATQPQFNLFSAGRTVTVHIPLSNVLDQAAVQQFAHFRDALTLQVRGVINHNA